MRFLRQSMIGLFLAAATLGFLVLAADLIGGAVQQRLTDTPPERPPRERVFSVWISSGIFVALAARLAVLERT